MDGPQPPVPDVAYHVAGEGRETFTKFEIRDRIRQGSITQDTELAPRGTEDYRPASAFPELSRYFALVAPGVGVVPPQFAVDRARPPMGAAGPAVAVPSVASHLAHLAYPFTGFGAVLVILGGLSNINPFLALVVGVFNAVYMQAIIRRTSEGSETMPAFADLYGPITFFIDFLKLVVVTLVGAWPIILALLIALVARPLAVPAVFIAAFVMLIYYPASFALLARNRELGAALSPSRVFNLIGILGADYAMAIIGFVLILLAAAAVGAVMALIGIQAKMAQELIGGLIGTFGTFYFDHLLGWGLYRHRNEL